MNKYLNWDEAIRECKSKNEAWVLVTVLDTRGSTPREKGSKMVVTASSIYDTIGGGQLEYKVTALARELIEKGEATQRVEQFPLAAKTQQCCGGSMSILFECFGIKRPHIHVFGAGHVAQALVPILAQLDASIHWIDNRKEMLSSQTEKLTPNTHYHYYDDVLQHIEQMPAKAYTIIVTHQHTLDYQLVEALLDRKDCQYIGLIGSKIKSLRFKRRLKEASFNQADIDSVICPIGNLDIPGKRPVEVAVSIAAQVIQRLHSEMDERPTQKNSYPALYSAKPPVPYRNDEQACDDT